MSGTRERRILNGLVILCTVAGFAFFILIAMPDQLLRGGLAERAQRPPELPSLTAILPPPPEEPPPLISLQEEAFSLPVSSAEDPEGDAEPPIDFAEREAPQSTRRLQGLVQTIAFPPSSLARGETSVLDSALGLHKKAWLKTPPGFEADVAFWRDIYATYDSNQVLLHHPRHLDIVYDIVDMRDIASDPRFTDRERERMREQRVIARRDRIVEMLQTIAQAGTNAQLTPDEWRIKKQFIAAGREGAIADAARDEAVRAQRGQRDKFREALERSGAHLGEIESIFAAYGLPRELTRLIFVESMFDVNAGSSAGARGIWQFMPGTGKHYLRMNRYVDERLDPIAATNAAARLLLKNYEELGSWPLALNAYNTGRGRMRQAVEQVGTREIGAIMRRFQHPGYQFASRNFFLEFLAALDVAEHGYRYFGEVAHQPPLRFELVRPGYHLSLPDVAHAARIPVEELIALNPGLTRPVREGRTLLPLGFPLRVPEGRGELFLAAAARTPKSHRGPLKHRVVRGETLATIADLYGVTVANLMKANSGVGRRPRRGETIVVPFDSPVASFSRQ